jgi:hypothetical protein
MSARQLLPPFSVYSAGAITKESKEDFSWHEHRKEFENVSQALDKVKGGREWLKDFKGSFHDEEAAELLRHMDLSYHSGASLNVVLRMYQFVLRDWDGWVLAQKTRALQDEYNAKQVSWSVVKSVLHWKGVFSDYSENELVTFKAKYKVEMDDDQLLSQLGQINTEYKAAYDAECQRYEDERNKERLDVLEHHYEHPSRWFDSLGGSGLAGHPSNIEAKHIAEMEKRHPGYQEHLMGIIKRLHAQKIETNVPTVC